MSLHVAAASALLCAGPNRNGKLACCSGLSPNNQADCLTKSDVASLVLRKDQGHPEVDLAACVFFFFFFGTSKDQQWRHHGRRMCHHLQEYR
jgi:hypothetical protein